MKPQTGPLYKACSMVAHGKSFIHRRKTFRRNLSPMTWYGVPWPKFPVIPSYQHTLSPKPETQTSSLSEKWRRRGISRNHPGSEPHGGCSSLPETRNLQHGTRNPKTESRKPGPGTRNPNMYPRPVTQTRNLECGTREQGGCCIGAGALRPEQGPCDSFSLQI